MDEVVDAALREQMGDDYELIIRMLKVVNVGSLRNRKETILEMLEMAADEKQGV